VSVAQGKGIDHFAVATLEEAQELRSGGVASEILILGPLLPNLYSKAIGLETTFAMTDADFIRGLAEVAQRDGKKARVHVKVDTGMSRVGFPWDSAIREILEVANLPGLEVEGIFSHFSTADSKDKTYTHLQYRRFMDVIEGLEKQGLSFKVRHCSNSGTVLDLPEMALDMVRPGIILYGLYPSGEVSRPVELKPVMRWTTRITRVRDWPSGTPVSYGCTYIT
jgi:alanine racemase